MASPPRFKQFTPEDYQEAPDWFRRFLSPMNETLGDVTGGLSQGLTLGDNLACAVNTFEFTVPATEVQTPVVARYSIAATQTMTSGVTAVLAFGTKVYDTHSAVTTPTTTWTFTCPAKQGGLYEVNASALITSLSGVAADVRMFLNINGTINTGLCIDGRTFGGASQFKGGAVVNLSVGDAVTVSLGQTSGASRDIWNDAYYTFVDVKQLKRNETTPSCFPYTFKATLKGAGFRPTACLLGLLRDKAGNTVHYAGTPTWEWDGKDRIKILNIPGLTAGHTYQATFVTF